MNITNRSTARTVLFVGMLLSVLMLGAALSVPVAARAADGGDKKPQVKRYYDQKNKDYHEWNDNEDKAYRSYLGENHHAYVDFAKVKAPQRQQYFDWRHEHPDSILFKVDIK